MARIPFLALTLALLFSIPIASSAEDLPFVGLDVDDDLVCDPAAGDLGRVYLPSEVGDTVSFDVFLDTKDSVIIFGCIFCVKDLSGVEFVSWEYATPDGWEDIEIQSSDAKTSAERWFPVSPWIPGLYPDFRCWLVQSTDWTFSDPLGSPAAVGTFRFRVAEEGPIEWLLDGAESGYMSTQFLSHYFTDPEMTCGEDSPPADPPSPPIDCAATDDRTDSVVVTWTDASDNEGGFRILRDGSVTGTVGPNTVSFTDRPPIGTYLYTILAFNWAGESNGCSDLGTRVPPGPPPAPTECAATDDRTDAVILTWQDNAENEIGYRVLRDGNLIAQLGADVETYEDHPTYGTHLYVVYAYGLTGASDECEDEGTRVLPPPPLPPSACDASDDRTDSVIVSWQDEADNESGFRIKRDGSLVGSVGANVERYRDVPPYGTYSYEVLAYNAGGESDPCGDEGTRQSPPPPPPPPNPPVDCDATDDRLDSIIVTWQDESENESGFRISRDHALIATVGADVEVYRDVPAVGTHVYSIRAYNLGGASDPCADEGTRLPSPPEAPGSCAATDDRVREIVVTWEDLSSDETAFHVYRDGEPIAELPAGAETHTDRVAAGDYEYAIRASNNGGFSGPCMAAGTALPGAVTWRVRPDGGGDFPTIQAAVDAAAPGDIVLLAPGVFRGEGNRGIDPHGKPITIRSETGHPAASAIDCEGVDRGFVLASEEGPGFALQAVTIRSGYHATDGGGAYIASSPSIRDCIFVGCISGGDGGALAVEGGTPEVSGCLFNKNSAGRGGAVFFEGASPSFDQCTFYGNESIDGGDAVYGGAFSSAAFAHVIVAASAGGGAIACGEGGAASFTCSDLFGNEGGDWTGCVAGQNGVAGNISLDPRFCGAESNSFRLHAQSPCLNPPCGRMGAYGRGCWGNVVSHQVGKNGEPGEASASDPGAFGEGPSVLLLPSPAHASVSILFSLPGAGGASVRVYDVAGRLVRSMEAPSSRGEVVWDGADDAGNAVAPGAYFVRIAGGERVETRRVVLIR